MIQHIRQERKARQRRQSGQAMVEYVLAIIVILGILKVIDAGVRNNIKKLWLNMAKDIAAACPGCKDSVPPEMGE